MVNTSRKARTDTHRINVEGSGWAGVCGVGDFWSEGTVLSFDFSGGYFIIYVLYLCMLYYIYNNHFQIITNLQEDAKRVEKILKTLYQVSSNSYNLIIARIDVGTIIYIVLQHFITCVVSSFHLRQHHPELICPHKDLPCSISSQSPPTSCPPHPSPATMSLFSFSTISSF